MSTLKSRFPKLEMLTQMYSSLLTVLQLQMIPFHPLLSIWKLLHFMLGLSPTSESAYMPTSRNMDLSSRQKGSLSSWRLVTRFLPSSLTRNNAS